MKTPKPETLLALKLFETENGKIGGSQLAATDAMRLISWARSLRRIYEIACERELTPKEGERESRLCGYVSVTLADYGLTCEFNGDPRGYAVYIRFADGSSNSWGGSETGYGI